MAMTLKTVGPGRGAQWLSDGLRLYMRRPLAFTGLFALFLVAALFVALVPVVGGVLQLMSIPLLSLGFMVASQSALMEGPVKPSQFLEPLRGDPQRRRSQLVLCALYGLLVLLSMWLSDVVADGGFGRMMELMRNPNTPAAEIQALLADRSLAAGALLGSALITLLTIPFWHAPALVHWAHQGPAQALFSSTLAVWRTRGAFLVYALTWFVLMLVFGVVTAFMFRLLGLGPLVPLIAMPAGLFFSTLFYVSLVFTFNDSFGMQ